MVKNRKLKAAGHDYKNILVVRLDRIGDVVLSTPALRALKSAYPDSRITFMVRSYAKDLVIGNPDIDDIILYDKYGAWKGTLEDMNLVKRLRANRFDLAVVLHPTVRTHWLLFLSGIPKRLGFDRKMGVLLTDRVPDKKHLGLKHEIDYTLGLLGHVGVKSNDRKMCVPVNRQSDEKIDRLFKDHGISGADKVITLNPGASCPSKRWPAARFAQVADILTESRGAKIVVITGASDKDLGSRVASSMKKKCLDLSGKTTIADVASILRRSKLFISNDSGPVHISCAVGTPVVAIFGRSDRGLSPERWGPSNKGDVVIHKPVGCLECLAHNCVLGFKCLDAITVGEVVKAAEELLR